nr:ABC transporter substrate-binding protein [uncultured Fretibacterium sp.]
MRFKDFFSLFFVLLFSFINSPTSALEDTLTIAAAYDAKALDPAVTIDTPSIFVGAKIHENLLCIDENSKLQPQLAESYEQIDSQAYRFILRKGVRFHNGEELKASDVKFSMDRAMSLIGSAKNWSLAFT